MATNRPSCFLVFLIGCVLISDRGEAENPFGINRDGYQSWKTITIDTVPRAGIQWLRVWGIWNQLETEQDVFDFQELDRIIDRAKANDLRIMLCFGDIPDWTGLDDPEFFVNYEDLVTRVVARYGNRIEYYSPLNEPNGSWVWDGTVSDYLALLHILHDAVSTQDSRARVVGPETVFSTSFFRNVLRGGCQELDVLAAHFYPGDFVGATTTMFDEIERVGGYRDIIAQECPGKPFWVTEYGVNSSVIGESGQALEYADAYRRTVESDVLGKLFLYRIDDHVHWLDWTRGIIGNNAVYPLPPPEPKPEWFPPKQAFWEIKEMIDRLVETRLLEVDSMSSEILVLTQGDGEFHISGAVREDQLDRYGDCLWSPVNNYKGIPGINVLVSHVGDPSLPTCGSSCDAPGQNRENSPWLGVHFTGLQDGAPYRVFLRFLTIPGHEASRGIRGLVPGSIPWKAFDQNTPPYAVTRTMHSEFMWEEWEVLLGTTHVKDGEIKVFFDDTGNNGSCIFFEANLTGVRLESTIEMPGPIFFDFFESGDTSAWD